MEGRMQQLENQVGELAQKATEQSQKLDMLLQLVQEQIKNKAFPTEQPETSANGSHHNGYVTMPGGKQLFVIISDKEYRACVYRISEPASDVEDETIIRSLGKPVLEMDKSMFPDLMRFAGIGSRIFIVGGADTSSGISVASRNAFIFDTSSSTLVRGPLLNSGKINPYLFTLGSKLFALSRRIYSADFFKPGKLEFQFEMLDTSDPEGQWCALPLPRLNVSEKGLKYRVGSVAAMSLGDGDGSSSLGDAVFISLEEVGTYVFDIDSQIWKYASDEVLPFIGIATTLPHAPSLCCGASLITGKYCAFQLRYGDNGFRVKQIKIADPYRFSTPLPPQICGRPRQEVLGPAGRLYFIDAGVDKPDAHDTLVGNRYVKVSALEFSFPKVGLSEVHSLRCNKRRKGKQGQALGGCNEGKKGKQVLKKLVEVTGLWRMCFDGGPICNPFIHVHAAFAM